MRPITRYVNIGFQNTQLDIKSQVPKKVQSFQKTPTAIANPIPRMYHLGSSFPRRSTEIPITIEMKKVRKKRISKSPKPRNVSIVFPVEMTRGSRTLLSGFYFFFLVVIGATAVGAVLVLPTSYIAQLTGEFRSTSFHFG